MNEEKDDGRVEIVRQISAENLKTGGFLFKLPEDATEEDQADFKLALEAAQESGKNFVLGQKVTVIDTKKVDVGDNKVEVNKTEEPITEEPKEEPKKEVLVQTEPAQPQKVSVQPPAYYAPNPQVQPGQQAYLYNPFVNQAHTVPQQEPIQQPTYQPQPLQPVVTPQVVYPNQGFYYPQPENQPQQTENSPEPNKQ